MQILAMTTDYSNLPTYNTIMTVMSGAALLILISLARQVVTDPKSVATEGYALALGVVGGILTATGLHMTLTWPLHRLPFDNIVFGEPSLLFGVMLLATAFYVWRRGERVLSEPDPVGYIARLARPMSAVLLGAGLILLAISAAILYNHEMYSAPPSEPISGYFAGLNPWLEPIFIFGLYFVTAVAALATWPAINGNSAARLIARWTYLIAGWLFLLFGALNYFTHIGHIINEM